MGMDIKQVNIFMTKQKLFSKAKNNSFNKVDSLQNINKRATVDNFNPNSLLNHHINPEEMQRQKEIAAKMEPIIKKLNSGQRLTSEEKEFLRQNNPALYDKVMKIEEECEKYRRKLNTCKSKEEANQLHSLKMIASLSGGTKNMDVFMKKALEEEFKAWEIGKKRSSNEVV